VHGKDATRKLNLRELRRRKTNLFMIVFYLWPSLLMAKKTQTAVDLYI
jgi:hypothetical protein